MEARKRGFLKRVGIAVLTALVLLLMLAESLGKLARRIFRKSVEDWLKKLPWYFAALIVVIALVPFGIIKWYELSYLADGSFLLLALFFVISKLYFMSVLAYLGHVYYKRLPKCAKRVYWWYARWRDYVHEFAWYKVVHRRILMLKEHIKASIKRYRELFKGRSVFKVIRRAVRLRFRRHN